MGRSTVEDEILRAIRRIIRAVDLHSRVLAQTHGLTGPQALILKELSRLEATSVGQLAQQVSLSPATVTDVLARLERRGLVRRTRSDADRRKVHVSATDAAFQLLQTGPSLLQERFLAQLDELEEWERTLMLSTLQRLATMMAAEAIEAAPVLSSGPIPGDSEATQASLGVPMDVPERG